VPGGETGQESIKKGLDKLKAELDDDTVVMVHDGNRPLVTTEIISDSLATFRKHGSAVAVIPCTEVVLESDDGVSSCQSIEREKLFRTQTPHTYTLGELFDAHAEAGHKKVVFENPSDAELKGYNPMSNSALAADKLTGLGWKGCFDLKTGTRKTLEYMQAREK